MNLYNNFIITTFIIFYFNSVVTMKNPNLITNACLDTVFPAATGLVFVVNVNNTGDDDLNVELIGDRCCLSIGEERNCDLLEVIGTCVERIPKGTTKIMKLVAPILDPFERVGHCLFHLDSKSPKRKRKTMRNNVKINFDTRLENKEQSMIIPRNARNCNGMDEDPLNDCQLVDCDTYYNGKKSYFNRKLRKCTNVPKCVPDDDTQLVYDTASNKCFETVLKKEDLEFIQQLSEGRQRTTKDIIIIKNTHNPVPPSKHKLSKIFKQSKISTPKITTLEDKISTNLIIKSSKDMHVVTQKVFTTTEEDKYFIKNRENEDLLFHSQSVKLHCLNKIFKNCSVNVLGVVILIQCCCIFAMICFLPKPCICNNNKKISDIFNYRQDVSVTTPLIDTSNIDTETTNYTSESNIDKKIKCYKACQKDVNINMSMSDDILSKCITRRDWHSKHLKYTPEKLKTNSDICKIQEKSEIEQEPHIVVEDKPKNIPETKIEIINETESEEREKKNAICKSIFRKLETKSDSEEKTPKCDSSEKEIQNHIYTDEMPKDESPESESVKNFNVFKTNDVQKNTFSLSTEKGEFSNDSIDDFLSERGMIYLSGDISSKFSFSSSSDVKKSSQTSGSSKTSKNNVVKNILSIFRRNSKVGHSSDPGVKKSGHDLELLHMSRASLYSSSNNDSEYLKCLKKLKLEASRTSL